MILSHTKYVNRGRCFILTFVLCVPTCPRAGVINDMDATIASIVAAADLPLSILIVGVGEADFSMMDTLDGDTERLSYGGKRASRDIVQASMQQHKCQNCP